MSSENLADLRIAICPGCGTYGQSVEFIRVHVTNGVLTLCRQCLDDVNRKNPELAQLRRLSPLCPNHGTGDGHRSGCPYCVLSEKDDALSRIDYVLGGPNEYECSLYDVDFDHSRVVAAVARRMTPCGFCGATADELLTDHDCAGCRIDSLLKTEQTYAAANARLRVEVASLRAALADPTG